MRPLTLLVSLLIIHLTGCRDPEHMEIGDVAAAPLPADSSPAHRELLMELAREAFSRAEVVTPPLPLGATVPVLRLSRPARPADELAQRLAGVLTAMEVELPQHDVLAWAHATNTSATGESISEPTPGIVAIHDAALDDLQVVNTLLLGMHIRVDTKTIPWEAARRATRILMERGIVEPSASLDAAHIAFVRSGIEGPDGTHEQWVDEVLFEANQRMEGVDIADAGVRIGVTPWGKISSIRVTGILVEPVGVATIETTTEALQEAFADYLSSSSSAIQSVHVSRRQPVYMLDPGVESAAVEPRYLIEYSLVVRDHDTLNGSRSTITLWGMSSPTTSVEVRLPATSSPPPR